MILKNIYNRDLIWKTSDGRRLKLREIPSTHLTNILNHIKKYINSYIEQFGKERTDYYIHHIQQELRMRKLNRIQMDNEEQDLF